MPELADVEGYRRRLAEALPGRTVRKVTVRDPQVLRDTTAQGLGRVLSGRTLDAPDRHGKWLFLRAEGEPAAVLHFGMTGRPEVCATEIERHPHDRLVLELDGGPEFRFRMSRKLGGVWRARSAAEQRAVTGPQGPDALTLDEHGLRVALAGRRGGLKAALMDQAVIAGLGNLLADETCWRAGLDPRRPVRDLDDDALRSLHRSFRWVLPRAADAGRVPCRRGWLTGVRDDDEPACPRRATPLERGTVAGRGTWWCPACQS